MDYRSAIYLADGSKKRAARTVEALMEAHGGHLCTRAQQVRERKDMWPRMFYGFTEWSAPYLLRTMGQLDRINTNHPNDGEWVYIDNGYLKGREYSRITPNRLQIDGTGRPDFDRLRVHGVDIEPWRPEGRHVLVCCQSDLWHRTLTNVSSAREWGGFLTEALGELTDRDVRVRLKSERRPFIEDLEDAFTVVTWSSNTALEAIALGVPAIVLGQCGAEIASRHNVKDIENPLRISNREEWLATLAANQWTVDEMRTGQALREMEEQAEARSSQ